MLLVRHAFQTYILIAFNSFFVLYLMCCFGNNPLYGFHTNKNYTFQAKTVRESINKRKICILFQCKSCLHRGTIRVERISCPEVQYLSVWAKTL